MVELFNNNDIVQLFVVHFQTYYYMFYDKYSYSNKQENLFSFLN